MRSDFVLVSPARNEAGKIENTLHSVTSQTCLPKEWVIVNDGSTDETEQIVRSFSEKFDFIRLVSEKGDSARSFGSKVKAFEAGYNRLSYRSYSFVGNLDCDVSFSPDYFENLFSCFEINPSLGLCGGLVWEEIGGSFVPQMISENSVAGAVQTFRRECFEQIGGYLPLKRGGIDTVAEVMARMAGREVRTLRHLQVKHYGRVTSGRHSIFKTRFNKGVNNYLLGYHPLFQISQSIVRLTTKPFLVGSLMMLCGYTWAGCTRMERIVTPAFVSFLRREQVLRLRAGFQFKRRDGIQLA
jgi:poly-beta-1,6-N-acetyl-D-glucosamine synthase